MDIARSVDAYILCDEVYRHLTQTDEWSPSIVDLYEKGISVSSMSKVFSLAGLRLGWIATRDEAALKSFLSYRDYNLISCGMFDDAVAAALGPQRRDAEAESDHRPGESGHFGCLGGRPQALLLHQA